MSNLHIKIAWRNIKKDISYSVINVIGLAIGIACTAFIFLYISDELNYDKHHENSQNIYRVVSHISETDDAFDWVVAQIPFGPQVKQDYPEILEYVQFIPKGRTLFRNGETKFYEEEVYYADTSVFKIFTHGFIDGDPLGCLREPNSIVLAKNFAERYFGDENPVGKTIETFGGESFNITGLIENVPENSHFEFSALISRSTLPERIGSWGNFGVFTYLLLPDKYDPENLENKFPELYEKHMASIFQSIGINIEYSLQPIREIHLHSKYQGEPKPTGDIWYVKMFAYIALFMLVIAIINYMNLATARSNVRAKEVAIMKVSGSDRKKIIAQFITESFVLVAFALIVSIGAVLVLLPEFNNLAGKFINRSILVSPVFVLSLAGIALFLGILGGSYPAFYMSGINPTEVIKGFRTKGTAGAALRKVLVVLQFSLSLIMIICTLTVFDQLDHIKNKDAGFDRKNIICIELSAQGTRNKFDVLKESLTKNPKVLNVGGTESPVGEGSPKIIFLVESTEGMIERGINFSSCDHHFIETMGIEIIEGRDFTDEIKSDTLLGVIINETLAKRMNWEKPIGKKVQFASRQGQEPARVVGLMKDYCQTGLYNEIESFMLLYRLRSRLMYVRLDNKDISSSIKYVEEQWNMIFPDIKFEYTFLENTINQQFAADEKRGKLFTLFSLLTIAIACLGLFGLASFTTAQKTPEMAVRKVLGINTRGIVFLLSKEFVALICMSIAIAFPIGYYIMDQWLMDYAHRTDIKIYTLVFSALVAIFATLATISFHTVRTAMANPVDSIKEG